MKELVIDLSPFGGAPDVGARLSAAGWQVVDWARGHLAEDAAYARARGDVPFAHWTAQGQKGGRLWLGGLFSAHYWDRRPIHIWAEGAWLARVLPHARFTLARRPVEDWLATAFALRGGDLARIAAHHRGVSRARLATLWAEEYRHHIKTGGGVPAERVTVYDPQDPAGVFSGVARALGGGGRPDKAPLIEARRDTTRPVRLRRPAPRPEAERARLANDLAAHALGDLVRNNSGYAACSEFFGAWDGENTVLDRKGRPLPLARERAGLFIAAPGPDKRERLESTLNEVITLGRAGPLCVDMQDSRRLGDSLPVGGPVLGHNRRAGAENVVLWPLPGLHTLGADGFALPRTADPVAFGDKADAAIWRGTISGHQWSGGIPPGEGQKAQPGAAAHQLFARMAAATTPAARAAAFAAICEVPRMAFLRRFIGVEGFDIGLVLGWALRGFARYPELAPYLRPHLGAAAFYRFRYRICLDGYDVPSNLIPALQSRSVVLLEQAGWQVFYSALIRPWEHYIPLAPGGVDAAEKLDWARRHPARCRQISRAARAAMGALADPALRQAMQHRILDGIW